MRFTRRNVLQKLALGIATLGTGMPVTGRYLPDLKHTLNTDYDRFNMSGFRASKIDVVRIGLIGLGNRGSEAVRRLAYLEGIEIKAICDKYENKVLLVQQGLKEAGLAEAKTYYGSEDIWRDLVDRPDLDLIYICTPWLWHTPMALRAMEAGKHLAVEVPAATTMDECWQLVETSERNKKHCMMLENCCYDYFEMLTLNMARNGLFGEIVHCEGAYIHDLMDLNFSKTYYADFWRLKENGYRNGSLYPTHGLGPVAQCLNINRGDRMDYLVSVSSGDFMMHDRAVVEAEKDAAYEPFKHLNYRGNMNTTTIRTVNGKSIMIQHDVTSPRPYSRLHLISGTKGVAQKYPGPERIAFGHKWQTQDELKNLYDQYTPPLVKYIGNIAKEVGGHGGMDFIMDWRLIDCLRNGLPLDQDVYDAASWTAVGLLSEQSVAGRAKSIDIPDFTNGQWQTNQPVDLDFKEGATTGVRKPR